MVVLMEMGAGVQGRGRDCGGYCFAGTAAVDVEGVVAGKGRHWGWYGVIALEKSEFWAGAG